MVEVGSCLLGVYQFLAVDGALVNGLVGADLGNISCVESHEQCHGKVPLVEPGHDQAVEVVGAIGHPKQFREHGQFDLGLLAALAMGECELAAHERADVTRADEADVRPPVGELDRRFKPVEGRSAHQVEMVNELIVVEIIVKHTADEGDEVLPVGLVEGRAAFDAVGRQSGLDAIRSTGFPVAVHQLPRLVAADAVSWRVAGTPAPGFVSFDDAVSRAEHQRPPVQEWHVGLGLHVAEYVLLSHGSSSFWNGLPAWGVMGMEGRSLVRRDAPYGRSSRWSVMVTLRTARRSVPATVLGADVCRLSLDDRPRLRLRVKRGLVTFDGRPLGFGALEGSALGFEGEAAAALHAAVVAAMVAGVADLQPGLVLLGRDRLAAVSDEVGQGAGEVPGLAR